MVRVRARHALGLVGLAAWLAAATAQAQVIWPPAAPAMPGGTPPRIDVPTDGPSVVEAEPEAPTAVVEEMLDGIRLGATFREVITRTYLTADGRRIAGRGGVPHFVGPSLESPEAVFRIFQKTPPQSEAPADPGAGGPPGGGMPIVAAPDPWRARPVAADPFGDLALPPLPDDPGIPDDPGAGNAGGDNGEPGVAIPVDPQPVSFEDFVIWIYLGHGEKPDMKAQWATYVLFDRASGKVVGIYARATGFMRWPSSPSARPGPNALAIQSSVGVLTGPVTTVVRRIQLGTRMSDVINRSPFGWPKPLGYGEDGKAFFLNYPRQNLSLTVGVNSRKVEGISVGVPLMVVRDPADDTLPTPASPGGATGAAGGPVNSGGLLPPPRTMH